MRHIRKRLFTEPCTLPDNAVFVEVNDTVYACCHSHIALGSLADDDIETIWHSRPARAVSTDVSTGQCASCPQDCIYRPATVSVYARELKLAAR